MKISIPENQKQIIKDRIADIFRPYIDKETLGLEITTIGKTEETNKFIIDNIQELLK